MMSTKLANQYINQLAEMQSPSIDNAAVGGGSADATVKLRPNGTLTAEIANASAGKMMTVTIETPVAFDVLGATVYKTSDNTAIGAKASVTIDNNTSAITDTIVPATGLVGLDKYSTLDTNYNSFDVDDDDLVITVSGSSASDLLVVLDIMLT